MKLLKHLFSSFILISLLVSCSTKIEEKEELNNLELEKITRIEPTIIDTLIGGGGVIRGVDFGLSVEEVRGIETARHDETVLSENGAQMVRFVTEFTLTKSMDVEYYFTRKNELDKIILVVYCESEKQQKFVFVNLLAKMQFLPDIHSSVLKGGDEHNFNVELVLLGNE